MPTLHFKGKTFLQNYHHSVKFHNLVAKKDKGLNKNPSLDDNLIIHGDNLKALKALLPTHAGKIKCIYIDPPYNTGNENWIYNDNVASPMIQKWLGEVVAKDDLTRHDKWCCMMYPRLTLLRELLTENGVIFISIDDNEAHHLRMMMDEIFGEENFVAQIVWRGGKRNAAKYVSTSHEYILFYVKDVNKIDMSFEETWKVKKEGLQGIYKKFKELCNLYEEDYKKMSSELKNWYKKLPDNDPAKDHSHYCHIDKKGIYFASDISRGGGGGPTFKVKNPLTGNFVKTPSRGWAFSSEKELQKALKEDLIHFTEDDGVPCKKIYLAESEFQLFETVFYKDRRASSKELREIFSGNDVFNFPKDVEIIKKLLKTFSLKNDLVLDSFAGSGTTGHAVLALNKEDGGNRKFILVECEDYADKITAERMRRVIKSVPNTKNEGLKKGLGGTFSYYELGEPVEIDSLLEGEKLPDYEDLAKYTFFMATGEQFDNKKIDQKSFYIGSSSTFEVFLIYTPDKKKLKEMALNIDFAEKINEKFPTKQKLVFAPACFMEDYSLKEFNIRFAQLPFEIYRMAE